MLVGEHVDHICIRPESQSVALMARLIGYTTPPDKVFARRQIFGKLRRFHRQALSQKLLNCRHVAGRIGVERAPCIFFCIKPNRRFESVNYGHQIA